jgi:hypothetical protein
MPEITFEGMQRFLKQLSVDYTWLGGSGLNAFADNEVELTATFAVPLYNPQTPLLITPGFAMNFLNGPVTTPTQRVEMPGHVYDAFLDTAWHPQATPWLGADLAFRIGIYSDFSEIVAESFRYTGNALGVVTLTPCLQLKAGVVYLDRVLIKMLPAGGLIWTPNPDVRFEILFPNPRKCVIPSPVLNGPSTTHGCRAGTRSGRRPLRRKIPLDADSTFGIAPVSRKM